MAHDLIASCAPTLMSTGLIHSPLQWPDLRLRIVNGVLGEVDLIACLSLERAGLNQNCFACRVTTSGFTCSQHAPNMSEP